MTVSGHVNEIDTRDEFDVFLDTWEQGERLRYSLLPQNLSDPLIRRRLLEDSTGVAPLERSAFANGPKVMADEELIARSHQFFVDRQKAWSDSFRDHVLAKGVPPSKFETFSVSFAECWIDGRKRRQDSPAMLAIKASIRDFDLLCNSETAGQFVIHAVDESIQPLFSPLEMAAIFQVNLDLLSVYLPDYIDQLDAGGPTSLDELYIRRGVYMPKRDVIRRELHYLSSYSLALGPVEQFAQTWTPSTRGVGIPSIFSTPVTSIQDRVVAFAPFIENMDLSQLEFVVAPPCRESPLVSRGEFGGIHEYSFD